MMDWQIGDIIRETLKETMNDPPIINTYLILDIVDPLCYLVHSMEHSTTIKLMPLDGSILYQKLA